MITTPVQGAAAPEALRLADSYARAHAMYCMENIYGTSESYTAALLEKRHCEREMLGVELRRLHALVEGLSAAQGDEKYNDTLVPFVSLMRKELHANASKGDRPGWLKMSADTALLEIYWHTAKLSAAVKNNDGPEIIEHSADVANMAMMLLDVCGAGMGDPLVVAAPKSSASPLVDSQSEDDDEGISRAEWIRQAERVYLIAGDSDEVAHECAKALCTQQNWDPLQDDLGDPYNEAMNDVEGRGPSPLVAIPSIR